MVIKELVDKLTPFISSNTCKIMNGGAELEVDKVTNDDGVTVVIELKPANKPSGAGAKSPAHTPAHEEHRGANKP